METLTSPALGNTVPAPTLAVQLLAIATIVQQRAYRHQSLMTTSKQIHSEYKFVVVGAGTAGSVVAGRLAELGAKVLVLEAGGPSTVLTDMPARARQQFDTEVDWAFRTTSQVPYAGNAFEGGQMAIARGRLVGGSHNANFMVYSRGNRRDYDSWALDHGATGWSYEEVLPYFLRSENNTDDRLVAANPAYHSAEGRIVVQTPTETDPIIDIIRDTLPDFGYALVDQNGPSQVGVNYFQQTIFLNGTRSTTAAGYLANNRRRENLQVLANALVTKILFDHGVRGGHTRAIGVELEYAGGRHQVFATKEVIVSAGSIKTPQLLMLSGIGPKEHLTSLGLPPLVDLPVGEHFLDHAFVKLDYEVLDPSLTISNSELSIANMYQYFANHSGPLTAFPLVYWYLNSPHNNQTDWPDIQIAFNVAPVENDLEMLVAPYKAEDRQQWREYFRDHLGEPNRLGVLCFQYRTHSEGQIYLSSTDMHDHPVLDAHFLTDHRDVDQLTSAIAMALRITHQPPFDRLVRLWRQPIPGCALCTSGSIWECAAYIECYARALTLTVGHQVGTARMGSDPSVSVVDPQLRVHGVDGLRVVDASTFPGNTNGNTNVPTIMIAERAVDFVKKDYNL